MVQRLLHQLFRVSGVSAVFKVQRLLHQLLSKGCYEACWGGGGQGLHGCWDLGRFEAWL